ncbi:hypothetical protein BGX38DRAFT_1154190 [Terfezia claveryi]|nr:hypothetical protein BGX38DRAFT_1154190 [Terfezia claveryi]
MRSPGLQRIVYRVHMYMHTYIDIYVHIYTTAYWYSEWGLVGCNDLMGVGSYLYF